MIDKAYIDEAIRQAEMDNPADIPAVHGLSSNKVRRLLNWLCKPEGTNYLEIGSHIGSTLIPALWNNPHTQATCIDLWTGWEGAKRANLDANLALHLPDRQVNVIEGDMFTVDLNLLIPGVNVFFYDGPHTHEGHYQGFVRYNPVFADRFIALVDDFNWEWAKAQTPRAFADLHYHVEAEWVLPARFVGDTETWWNSLYIAIVEKPLE